MLQQEIIKLESKIEQIKNELVIKLGSLMVVGFGLLAVLMRFFQVSPSP